MTYIEDLIGPHHEANILAGDILEMSRSAVPDIVLLRSKICELWDKVDCCVEEIDKAFDSYRHALGSICEKNLVKLKQALDAILINVQNAIYAIKQGACITDEEKRNLKRILEKIEESTKKGGNKLEKLEDYLKDATKYPERLNRQYNRIEKQEKFSLSKEIIQRIKESFNQNDSKGFMFFQDETIAKAINKQIEKKVAILGQKEYNWLESYCLGGIDLSKLCQTFCERECAQVEEIFNNILYFRTLFELDEELKKHSPKTIYELECLLHKWKENCRGRQKGFAFEDMEKDKFLQLLNRKYTEQYKGELKNDIVSQKGKRGSYIHEYLAFVFAALVGGFTKLNLKCADCVRLLKDGLGFDIPYTRFLRTFQNTVKRFSDLFRQGRRGIEIHRYRLCLARFEYYQKTFSHFVKEDS